MKGLAGSRDAGHAQAEVVAGATIFEQVKEMVLLVWPKTCF